MASLDIGANLPVSAVQSSTVQPPVPTTPAPSTPAASVATDVAIPASSGATSAAITAGTSSAAPQVQTSLSVDAGTVPIEHARVDEIRKAVQSGNYPLVPAEIGDAMVAAGLMLRKTS